MCGRRERSTLALDAGRAEKAAEGGCGLPERQRLSSTAQQTAVQRLLRHANGEQHWLWPPTCLPRACACIAGRARPCPALHGLDRWPSVGQGRPHCLPAPQAQISQCTGPKQKSACPAARCSGLLRALARRGFSAECASNWSRVGDSGEALFVFYQRCAALAFASMVHSWGAAVDNSMTWAAASAGARA